MPQPAHSNAPLVFIRYAHADNKPEAPYTVGWLDRLLTHLKPLVGQGGFCCFTDKDIKTGREWDARIHEKLKRANAVVLMISPPAGRTGELERLPGISKNG